MKIFTRQYHLSNLCFTKVTLNRCERISEVPSGIDYFLGDAPSLDVLRNKLNTYLGGEITCEKNDSEGIAKVCINHPERRNALSGKMMVDFENVVNNLQSWSNGKGVIVYGANEIFCSGGDLNFARKENNAQSGYEMAVFMQNAFTKFSRLPLVSIAFISGAGAIGGGSEFAAACDFRLCSSNEKTKIGFVHSKTGIVPAWGGTKRLVDIVGKREALDLILTARLLNNKESLEIGLVDEVVDDFPQAYQWLVDRVKPHHSVTRAAKLSVVNASQTSDEVYVVEGRIFASLWGSPANKAALQKNAKHK